MQGGSSYVRKLLAGGIFCGTTATFVTGLSISVIQLVSPGPNAHLSNARETLQLLFLFPFLVMMVALRWSFPIGFVAGVILAGWWQWGVRSAGSLRQLGIETILVGALLSVPVPDMN